MVWQTDILTSIWRGCSKIKCDKADTSPDRLCLGRSKGSTNMTGHPVPPSVKDWWPPHLGMLSANDLQLSAPRFSQVKVMTLPGAVHILWLVTAGAWGHWPLILNQNYSAGVISAPVSTSGQPRLSPCHTFLFSLLIPASFSSLPHELVLRAPLDKVLVC